MREGGFREHYKQEWAKFREMNFAEKRWYIWEYYKFHLLGLAIGIFLIGSIVNWIINPPPDDYLHLAWLDIPATSFELSHLSWELTFNMVEDLDRERVEITNFTAVENARTNHAIQTRFISFLTIGALDAFVTTREGVEDVTAAGFTRPLTEVKQYLAEINPQLYATIEERLFVIEMESEVESEIESNDDSEYVQFIAVSLAGSPKLSLVGIDCENVYLCMIVNSERFYNIARALEVLLDGA